MNHLHFVIAAFAVTGIGIAWLLVSSYLSMRRSEDLANDLQNRG
jgi:acyl-coenzyme A synthetase/AMP-(fatty) acid ligase